MIELRMKIAGFHTLLSNFAQQRLTGRPRTSAWLRSKPSLIGMLRYWVLTEHEHFVGISVGKIGPGRGRSGPSVPRLAQADRQQSNN
jgi:hypothetical protein